MVFMLSMMAFHNLFSRSVWAADGNLSITILNKLGVRLKATANE